MWNRIALTIVAGLVAATPAFAQSEAALKQAFEGRTFVVNLDMPATQMGVDVYPERSQPVEFNKVAGRLKEYGTSIHRGESQTITQIKLKRDHIEVHLGGGGYGTFADNLSAPQRVSAPSPYSKTSRERDLEDRIKHANNSAERRRLQRELDDLRSDKRQGAANAAVANRLADQEVRDRRLQSGSRFNVRFDGNSVPADYLTPEGLAAALSRLGAVDGFEAMSAAQPVAPMGRPAGATTPLGGIAALKKGLSLEEVEKALGPADDVTRHDAGGLEIVERTYIVGERKVVARFAAGVLIEYMIQSK
jgi:hypothetical protein